MNVASRIPFTWRRRSSRWPQKRRRSNRNIRSRPKSNYHITGAITFFGFLLWLFFLRRASWVADDYISSSVEYLYSDTIALAKDGGNGDQDTFGEDEKPRRRYDPKARAFVDPKLRPRWGPEADKGREKRRLFNEIQEMSKTRGRPQLSLTELMDMPSTYDPSWGVSDTTIILNHWKRTTLPQQLDAILAQTVIPLGGVWVCLFNSPREKEYHAIIENYREKFVDLGGLYMVASSYNFKYYGRFQLALQARTRYVWVVDDDVMPGKKYMQQLSHIAGIAEAEGADGSVGPMALGSVGWIMPGVKKNGRFYSYRYQTDKGGLYLPDKRYGIPVPHLQEVDLLCSHWFIETDWVRVLFREHWETASTGEDYMLAYSLRKYAGVKSFILPMDLSDSETWGNKDVDWEMQNQGGGATTVSGMVPLRDRLWHRLFKRGGEYFLSPRYAREPQSLMLVIDGVPDVEALRPLYHGLAKTVGSHALSPTHAGYVSSTTPRPPLVVLTGRGDTAIPCSRVAIELGLARSGEGKRAAICDPNMFNAVWDLAAGRHYPRQSKGKAGSSGGRDPILMSDLSYGLLGVVDTARPLAVVSVAGSGHAAGPGGKGGGGAALDEALSVVSAHSGVPVVRLPRRQESSRPALLLSELTASAFGAWNKARIDILVLYAPVGEDESSNNPGGIHNEVQLEGLLDSLSKADYLGDQVDLKVVSSSGRVPRCVDDLEWIHGAKIVHEGLHSQLSVNRGHQAVQEEADRLMNLAAGRSTDNMGVTPGFMTRLALRSWTPRDPNNFVLVLESDRKVSRLFYAWLKFGMLEMEHGMPRTRSGMSWRSGGGICLPSGVGSRAWLFPSDYWQNAQLGCLGLDGDSGCDLGDPLRPPDNSLCPPFKGPRQSLACRSDRHGKCPGDREGLLDNDGVFLTVAKHHLYR